MTRSQAPVPPAPFDLTGTPRVSPLHDFWVARSTANLWTLRGSFTLPDVLQDPVEEAAAFGVSAAFADLSDRIVWTFQGDSVLTFLSALTGEPQAAFQHGGARRVVWCDALGFVRGSGLAGLREPGDGVLATAVSDAAWFQDLAQVFDVQATVRRMAGLRVAGPHLPAILDASGITFPSPLAADAPGLGPLLALWPAEDAIDLWCEPEQAMALAWVIARAGARPAGARALNVWRVATGLLAAGVDWVPAHLATNPAQFRRRNELMSGGYMSALWDSAPPEGANAALWPATGQFFSIFWAPPQGGRAAAAPFGGTIRGPAATD